ncbi:hypothetical protein [Corynebacterium lowii]|uniref:META domain protein n=1 Tax=Corynebacterium lowii TaxID=1544413 RepID=A0A0Q0U2Y3_9CORY|nr:hypothetical protein [Corynebacterium lowii]KQB86229.1 hypothetical protein Clow_01583 [Corynebacterium lowii]MDP9852703.1 hypothetical protein [Corynebacterium lowii]
MKQTRQKHPAKAATLAATIAATALAACAQEHSAVVGPTWQVTGLYLDPTESGDLPASAAGLAMFSFGEGTIAGSTGCSRIQGIVNFTKDGESSPAQDADTVAFEQVDFEDRSEDCQGGAAYTDATLRDLLRGDFTIAQPSEAELVLTQRSDEVDAPAIRLTTNAA